MMSSAASKKSAKKSSLKALKTLNSPEISDHFCPKIRKNNTNKTMTTKILIVPTSSTTSVYHGKDPKLFGISWFSMVLLTLLATFSNPSEATFDSSRMYDRYCVGNFGCETDFQDMIFNVSLFQNFIRIALVSFLLY